MNVRTCVITVFFCGQTLRSQFWCVKMGKQQNAERGFSVTLLLCNRCGGRSKAQLASAGRSVSVCVSPPIQKNKQNNSTRRNKVPYYEVLCGMWYLSIHTKGIAMETTQLVPAPCLFCCYGSHPRIIFSPPPCSSLVFVSHNWLLKPQSSMSPFPHILFSAQGPTSWIISVRVCAGGDFQKDTWQKYNSDTFLWWCMRRKWSDPGVLTT